MVDNERTDDGVGASTTVRDGVRRTRARLGGVDPVGVVVAVVATAVYFYRLGDRPLWMGDEAIYAVSARNAVDHGYWLVPHAAGFDELHAYPFLEKPPLAIWLQASSIGLFGPTEFAVRVPSALAAVGVTILAYALATRVDRRAAGVVAAGVFLTTPAVLVGINGARYGATDLLHTFFGSVVVALLWFRATDRIALPPVVTGVALAALLLTKGFAAGVFVLAAAPLVVLRFDRFGRRFLAVVGLTAGVVVGTWAALAYATEGQYFVREIFLEQVWFRITGEMGSGSAETAQSLFKYPYTTMAQRWFWPWWFLFLAGTVTAVRTAWRNESAEGTARLDVLFPVWWAGAAFVPFALVGTSPWYLIPTYVPASLVVGRLLADAADGRRTAVVGLLAGISFAAAGTDRLLYDLRGGDLSITLGSELAWIVPPVVALSLVACRVVTATRSRRWSVSIGEGWTFDAGRFLRLAVVGVTLVALVAALVGVPSVNAVAVDAPGALGDTSATDAEMRDFGQRTNAAVPEGATIHVQPNARAFRNYASYAFYADRPLRETPVEELRSSPSVEYALLTTDGRSLVDDRDPTVLVESRALELVLVRVDPHADD
jgi:4-amino-4-deoxy-L-arabinose transferase-like glycosyltransferase